MSKEMLKKPLSKNQLDDMTTAMVNAMKYADGNVLYPNIEEAKQGDGVEPEWFYPIFNGSNEFSELSAIHMYTGQESKFENIGELMLGIGMTEMKHYGKLSEFIIAIGGSIEQGYDNSDVELGEDAEGALQIAISGEEKTIEFYEKLQAKISKLTSNKTTEITLQLLSKLIADENVHLELLKNELSVIV